MQWHHHDHTSQIILVVPPTWYKSVTLGVKRGKSTLDRVGSIGPRQSLHFKRWQGIQPKLWKWYWAHQAQEGGNTEGGLEGKSGPAGLCKGSQCFSSSQRLPFLGSFSSPLREPVPSKFHLEFLDSSTCQVQLLPILYHEESTFLLSASSMERKSLWQSWRTTPCPLHPLAPPQTVQIGRAG